VHVSCILHPGSILWSNGSMAEGKRILAVDYGGKNIGLACSDDLALTVQPLPSIPNRGRNRLLKNLRKMVQELDIREIVLGMPVNMDGTRGDACIRMEELLEFLKNGLNIPATEMDERLSTVEALEYWKEMNPRRRRKYRTIDSLAAALILERHLKEK
jgi:putative holliday junction resolvase